MKQSFLGLLILGILVLGCQQKNVRERKVLVFSKTEGYRHASIPTGQQAIMAMGEREGFWVDTTENAADFNEENLSQYSAVVFLNTTMDVLDYQQQSFFERYIQAGGGFVGIHAAADTEYDWPWYGRLVGGYFESHPNNPNVRQATCNVIDHDHLATDSLPDSFHKSDEFYNYKNINPDINVLVTIDESTYDGGTNGDFHPMTWYHDYDGGRAFYTAFGHTDETYSEPEFLQLLSGGIAYAIGENKALDYSLARYEPMPDASRFTKAVLENNLYEPLELEVLPDGDILFIERRGSLKKFKQELDSSIVIHEFDVYIGLGRKGRHEDGLLGLALDPKFAENNWIYLYYSPNGDEDVQNLSRFELNGDQLDLESEIVMLQVGVQRQECCHTGGSIEFGPDGNLFLSTGDDTNPFESDAFNPIDERPGRGPWDAQKGPSNTNDLRGKILRITPQPDGTYTIPEGNLFPPGTPDTRPEIYVMGCRNPYRIAIDSKSGYLYWGDVGPDARADDEIRGPRGIDEFNQARESGFFGWPYFTGPNYAYAEYDFTTGTAGAKFSAAEPVNNSPNNTGLKTLPPAKEAFIYYGYADSEEWPILGSGGKNAMAGPVYYGEYFPDGPNKYPKYFDGKIMFYDWIRSKIFFITLDQHGDLDKIEPFMPEVEFNNPMDFDYGPDGKLYMLEYGTGWFTQNVDARLVRFDYKAGNRAPVAKISANKVAGGTPLTVQFSSEGSMDHDQDPLSYHWEFFKGASSDQAHPEFTFNAPGRYQVQLTLSDPNGASSTETIEIQAGNNLPEIAFEIAGNQTFYWDGRNINYQVLVTDQEDGSLADGQINPTEVSVSTAYQEQVTKQTVLGHLVDDEALHQVTGATLIADSDCKSCHAPDRKSIGPSYADISNKYRRRDRDIAILANKVINGGSGVWGETPMAAHPSISLEDARMMVTYILSFGEEGNAQSLPVEGTFTPGSDQQNASNGVHMLKAMYTDRGADAVGASTSQQIHIFRSNRVKAVDLDQQEDMQIFKTDEAEVVLISGPGYLSFNQIDLTDIRSITLSGSVVGQGTSTLIEIRLDSPDGKKIAEANLSSTGKALTGGNFAAQALATLDPVNSTHDLYFVAKVSEAAGSGGSLSTITFNP
jgi:cytochrome c